MKGIIALDIDGTTTVPGQPITQEVVSYLKNLTRDKWQLLFITGRTLHGSQELLSDLPFPYFLAVQNGAIILDMPSKKIVSRKYLHKSIIPMMHEICDGEPTDFVIFAGCERQDFSYYRPQYFSDELRKYINARAATFRETWRTVQSFDELDFDEFPSVKCFGLHHPSLKVAQRIEKQLGLHVPVIRDPFNSEYFVVQATHSEVSKGHALRTLQELLSNDGVVIAAGDDYNDCTMLDAADIKVVMATAPADMLMRADIVAPPAEQHGLIAGLNAAIVMAQSWPGRQDTQQLLKSLGD
ncbi:MAG: HAD family phosphatase [Parachlamydiaceae bacterium]|nr:HAD family phosphatase [Parachlamydiaceae bacterium]